MKVNPNKIITIYAQFSGATQELEKQVSDISARLYKGDQHIRDLEAVKTGSPMSWKAQHIFPKDSLIGDDYKVDFEVKIKDQKDSIIETQELELVRDLNLQSHVEIKDNPPSNAMYDEVPGDIRAYLDGKNE